MDKHGNALTIYVAKAYGQQKYFCDTTLMVKQEDKPITHTSETFRQVATKFEFLMTRFREFADEMDRREISSVKVSAVPTREKALVWLQRSLKHAAAAVNSAIMESEHDGKRKGPIHLLTKKERDQLLKEQEEQSEEEHAAAPKERRIKGGKK